MFKHRPNAEWPVTEAVNLMLLQPLLSPEDSPAWSEYGSACLRAFRCCCLDKSPPAGSPAAAALAMCKPEAVLALWHMCAREGKALDAVTLGKLLVLTTAPAGAAGLGPTAVLAILRGLASLYFKDSTDTAGEDDDNSDGEGGRRVPHAARPPFPLRHKVAIQPLWEVFVGHFIQDREARGKQVSDKASRLDVEDIVAA
jgi:hypothetical protein